MITLTQEGRRRVVRHIALGVLSILATAVLAAMLHGGRRERVSTATAYMALVLLATTLVLAPLNVLMGRPNPVSFNRRRDFGIWSALVGIGHAGIGLTVHLHGRMYLYFLGERDTPGSLGCVPIPLAWPMTPVSSRPCSSWSWG